jgi:hypothetical protein
MKIKIHDIEVNYQVHHRKVKYARLEIKNEELHLIVPPGVKDYQKLINKHEEWIYRKLSRISMLKTEAMGKKLDFSRSDETFRKLVQHQVNKISQDMEVEVNRVSFRKMKTRWGSCSSAGNITINRRLAYLPESLIEYVVHHELCHLKIRNHNREYWDLISLKYPDYEKYENELSIYWFLVKDIA